VARIEAKGDEICLLVIYLQPNYIENCQDHDFWQVMKFI